MHHPFSRSCPQCGSPTHAEQFDLDRCVERLEVHEQGGKPVTHVIIKMREGVYAFCGRGCWEAAEPGLAKAFDVQTTYPPFGFVTSCCRCGGSVNRTKEYVRYSITRMTYPQSESGMASCADDRDWVVLCYACEHPDGPAAASLERVIEVLKPEIA